LRADAEVIEGPTKGQVRVAAGALRLWVDVAELRRSGKTRESADKPRGRHDDDALARPERRILQTPGNTLDVRGMLVDDATAMVESFLDQLFGRDEPAAFIVHGLGSGALRDGVRRFLAQPSPYVREFRQGEREEGGDRVTVVLLR